MSGDAAHRADFAVYVQHQRGVVSTRPVPSAVVLAATAYLRDGAAAVVVSRKGSACLRLLWSAIYALSATRISVSSTSVGSQPQRVKAAVRGRSG